MLQNKARLADQMERLILVGLLGFLAYRLLPHLNENPANLIYLISETLVVVMVAIRRSASHISVKPADWFFGFAGTLLPLVVVRSESAGFVFGGALMMLGFGIAVGAQLSLFRSFGVVAANRGVKTAGLYGLIRHPMYLGYFVIYVGFLLVNPTSWNAGVYAACVVCQVWRIHAEERVLLADAAYAVFARRVRYRLLPFVY